MAAVATCTLMGAVCNAQKTHAPGNPGAGWAMAHRPLQDAGTQRWHLLVRRSLAARACLPWTAGGQGANAAGDVCGTGPAQAAADAARARRQGAQPAARPAQWTLVPAPPSSALLRAQWHGAAAASPQCRVRRLGLRPVAGPQCAFAASAPRHRLAASKRLAQRPELMRHWPAAGVRRPAATGRTAMKAQAFVHAAPDHHVAMAQRHAQCARRAWRRPIKDRRQAQRYRDDLAGCGRARLYPGAVLHARPTA